MNALSKLPKILVVLFVAGSYMLMTTPVEAGPASCPTGGNFEGSNLANYYCPERTGFGQPCPSDATGDYLCTYSDGTITKAIPKPPTIQIIEIWFVRVIYIMWAVSGIVFTFILMGIGVEYMTALGNEYLQADAIKRLRRWFIGLALVFLSYPVLNTTFNLLPFNDENQCIIELLDNTPGFRIFFPNACTIEAP